MKFVHEGARWFGVYYIDQHGRGENRRRIIGFRDGSVLYVGDDVVSAEIPRNWFAVLVEEH